MSIMWSSGEKSEGPMKIPFWLVTMLALSVGVMLATLKPGNIDGALRSHGPASPHNFFIVGR
jgi:hypothetical protein